MFARTQYTRPSTDASFSQYKKHRLLLIDCETLWQRPTATELGHATYPLGYGSFGCANSFYIPGMYLS